jgi:O-antigen/teichoic acid export membrane protein
MKINTSIIRSVFGSTIFKLGSSLVAFVSVPLLLKALGTGDYGIWVTLTALAAWLNLFDFGSGYSLKNKITESIALSNKNDLQILIAGTIQFYVISAFLILGVFLTSLFVLEAFKNNLLLASIIYLPIILSFPFTLGHFMIQGLKKFNLFNSLLLIQSIIWMLIIVLFRYQIIKVTIYELALMYSLLYVFINFLIFFISLRLLNFNWRELFKWSNFIASKSSLLVGGRFFLLQVSSLLLFSLGNIMTYNNLGINDVAQFDTVNKIYMMGITIFNVLISVFWVEISQAKALKNQHILIKMRKNLILIASGFSVSTVLVSFLVPYFIAYWTKGIIHVSINQLLPFILLTCIQFFAYVGAVFLNAFEELKGQVIFSVVASVFIIPLGRYFFYLNFGIGSVPLASAFLIIPSLIYVYSKSNFCINNLNQYDRLDN